MPYLDVSLSELLLLLAIHCSSLRGLSVGGLEVDL